MKSNRYSSFHGFLGVLIASLTWGTTGVSASFAKGVSPFAISAAAWGIGGVLLFLMAARSSGHQWRKLRAQWRYLFVGTLAIVAYPLAFYDSMRMAGVTVGTVVSIGSAPLFSALIERVMERARMPVVRALGILLGVAGIALLCLAEKTQTASDITVPRSTFSGIGLALIAGLTYALYSWVAHRLIFKGISSRVAMGVLFGLGGVCLWPVLWETGTPFLHSWLNAAVGAYMILVPVCIGYLCFGYGLARIKASTATTISLLEPVVAALLAASILEERLPALGWGGIVLIFTCLAMSAFPTKSAVKRRPSSEEDPTPAITSKTA